MKEEMCFVVIYAAVFDQDKKRRVSDHAAFFVASCIAR